MAQSISQEAIGATGLPGATAASRYAGATVSGAPTTGTFAVGDFIIDQSGKFYVCTAAGTPGTWGAVGGSSALTYNSSYIASAVTMTSASTAYNITSLSLTAGTWLVNGNASFYSPSNTGIPNQLEIYLTDTSASLSGTNIYGSSWCMSPNNSSGTSLCALSISRIITLSTTTTIYLECVASVAGCSARPGGYNVASNGSGMNVIKIA